MMMELLNEQENITHDYFTNFIGTPSPLSEEALHEVLEKLTSKISNETYQCMEEEIMLEELKVATTMLGKKITREGWDPR